MNAQDRSAVVSLLNYLASKYLHTSKEVRAAAAHFDVTLTTQHEKAERPFFNAPDDARNFVVDVFRPKATSVHGERYDFHTQEEADFFAAMQRGEVLVKDTHYTRFNGLPVAVNVWNGTTFVEYERKTYRLQDAPEALQAAVNAHMAPEPDAIPFEEARELFVDHYSISDAYHVGKRYIVGIAPASLEGKLTKYGCYWHREDATRAIAELPQMRGIDTERAQLVVLTK